MHIEFEGIVGPVEVLLGHDRHLSTGRMNLPASRNPNRIIELYQAWLDQKLGGRLQSLIARGPTGRMRESAAKIRKPAGGTCASAMGY